MTLLPGWTQQQTVVAGAAGAVLLTILFPPFSFHRNGLIQNLGYAFLFDPPEIATGIHGTVNIPLLLTEWAAIIFVAVLVWIFLRAREKRTGSV